MREETVQTLKLTSFVKLCSVLGAVTGLITGIVGFVASLFGGNVFIALGALPKLTGIAAGLTGLPFMPVAFAMCGLLLAPVLHWPVQFVLRRLGGVQLSEK